MKHPINPRWLTETLATADGWVRLIVIVLHREKRWHYEVAHDGLRLGRHRGLIELCDDYPDIAEEVAAWALR